MSESGYEPMRQDFDNAAYEDDYEYCEYDMGTYDGRHPREETGEIPPEP